MLIRFEVSGFKNLSDVTVDFSAFTCIAGENGVGKSNLFDAVQFLAATAQGTFLEACAAVRSGGSPDLETVLASDVLSGMRPLTFAAEVIVRPTATDDLGQLADVEDTYLRYELGLEVVPGGRPGTLALALADERLVALERRVLERRLGDGALPAVINAVRGGRRKKPFIETQHEDQPVGTVILARSGAQGRPRRVAAARTPRTVLSSLASAEFPVLLAVREEMRSWRFLALEPSAMRAPDSMNETGPISEAGAHVPASLLGHDPSSSPQRIDAVLDDLNELVDVRSIRVVEDEARQSLELRAKVGDAPELPARSLSDGTLRFLTLAALGAGDTYAGLLAMEEPENGIHPSKIHTMVALLRRLAQPRDGEPRQVIINTHSPYMVEDLLAGHRDDLLVAVPWRRRGSQGVVSVTAFHPLAGTWRAVAGGRGSGAGNADSGDYCSLPVADSRLRDFMHNPSRRRAAGEEERPW